MTSSPLIYDHGDAALSPERERRTAQVVMLTFAMMVLELVVGKLSGSMALEADGWHMATHVGALGLSWLAYWYARTRGSSAGLSFGPGKLLALSGYTSALLLSGVAVYMAVESVLRLASPTPLVFSEALPVAVLGLVVNAASLLLLGHDHDHAGTPGHAAHDHGAHGHAAHEHGAHDHADHDHAAHAHAAHDHVHEPHAHDAPAHQDHNYRAAYLHVLADALTSVLAIVAIVAAHYLGWVWLDPLMGLVGAVLVGRWSIGLLRSASRQLLDVCPSRDMEEGIRRALESIDDVRVADLHLWELTPGRRSCVVSLVSSTPRDTQYYRERIRDVTALSHLTVEVHAVAPQDT